MSIIMALSCKIWHFISPQLNFDRSSFMKSVEAHSHLVKGLPTWQTTPIIWPNDFHLIVYWLYSMQMYNQLRLQFKLFIVRTLIHVLHNIPIIDVVLVLISELATPGNLIRDNHGPQWSQCALVDPPVAGLSALIS